VFGCICCILGQKIRLEMQLWVVSVPHLAQ
jgi:hypothetical protein